MRIWTVSANWDWDTSTLVFTTEHEMLEHCRAVHEIEREVPDEELLDEIDIRLEGSKWKSFDVESHEVRVTRTDDCAYVLKLGPAMARLWSAILQLIVGRRVRVNGLHGNLQDAGDRWLCVWEHGHAVSKLPMSDVHEIHVVF